MKKKPSSPSSKEAGKLLIGDVVKAEVLARLSIRSLMRFKCVCRSWNSLVSSSCHFARRHRVAGPRESFALVATAGAVLSSGRRSSPGRHGTTTQRFSVLSADTLEVVRRSIPPPPENLAGVAFVGRPRNGTVCLRRSCLSKQEVTMVLWNPTTGESRRVPPCLPTVGDYWAFFFHAHGFGFDPSSRDYMIVRFHLFTGGTRPVYVYSSATDAWSRVETNLDAFPLVYDTMPRSVCPDGNTCYWIAFRETTDGSEWDLQKGVLSFDFREQAFRLLPLPPADPRAGCEAVDLAERDGVAVLVAAVLDAADRPLEYHLWTLRNGCDSSDNGEGGCNVWTELWKIQIPPSFGLTSFAGFWKDDRVLFLLGNGELVFYDVNTGGFDLVPSLVGVQVEGIVFGQHSLESLSEA